LTTGSTQPELLGETATVHCAGVMLPGHLPLLLQTAMAGLLQNQLLLLSQLLRLLAK